MKTLITLSLLALSASAFADTRTSYDCSATAQNGASSVELNVSGTFSQTGAAQFPISVSVDGQEVASYKGATAYLSEKVVQIQARKDGGNQLELNFFSVSGASADPKNYIEVQAKVNGQVVTYKSKDVSCDIAKAL